MRRTVRRRPPCVQQKQACVFRETTGKSRLALRAARTGQRSPSSAGAAPLIGNGKRALTKIALTDPAQGCTIAGTQR